MQAYCLDGDGIYKIKEFLKKIKDLNITIKYLGAPTYMLKYVTISPSDLQKKEKEMLELINKEAKNYNIIYEINKYERD
jgi:translation initiation factor 2 alpha subunit (eIF-2alpha)